jgi:hypothetical protein
MNQPELVLGFCLREEWLPEDAYWPERRRMDEMLCPQVDRPASVDSNVWRDAFGCAGIPIGESSGRYFGMPCIWWSLSTLVAQWQGSASLRDKRVSLIALSWPSKNWGICKTSVAGRKPWWHSESWPSCPQSVEASWEFLGLDVADLDFLSRLAGGSFPRSLVSAASRVRWCQRLNQRHLFRNEDDAFEYVNLCRAGGNAAERANETYAFGIWQMVQSSSAHSPVSRRSATTSSCRSRPRSSRTTSTAT